MAPKKETTQKTITKPAAGVEKAAAKALKAAPAEPPQVPKAASVEQIVPKAAGPPVEPQPMAPAVAGADVGVASAMAPAVAGAGSGNAAVGAPAASVPAVAGMQPAAPIKEDFVDGLMPARPVATPTGVEVPEPMVRRAAALRAKYRRDGGPICLPVEQVGFHPCNRNGQPPNGTRVVELCTEILAVGFDAEEANVGGLVVEAAPGSDRLHKFNADACENDSLLAPVVAGWISFGSLSHSHLHQILRNIKGKVLCNVGRACDADGRLDLGKLQGVDAAFAQAVTQGLRWEILSHAIEIEEPDGCAVIQAACNSKNSLFLMRHEMQALSELSTMTTASAVAEHALGWEAARQKLAQTLPGFATDAAFVDLFRFVVDLGANKAPFLADLQAFHAKFVDPKTRRARLSAFTALNLLPIGMPHMKVAGLKWLYTCMPRDGTFFLEGLSAAMTRKASTDASQKALWAEAEAILRFFHVTCLGGGHGHRGCGVGQVLGAEMRVKFLGNLDKEIFHDTAVARDDPEVSRIAQLRTTGQRYFARLGGLAPKASLPNWPFPWTTVVRQPAPAVAKASTPTLQPRILRFVDGRPVTGQDEYVPENPVEDLAWREFMSTKEVCTLLRDHAVQATVMMALYSLHAGLGFGPYPLQVQRGGDEKRIRVVAAVAVPKGGIKLVPLVNHPLRMAKQCQQGWAPDVVVEMQGERSTLYLAGTSSWPQRLESPAAGSATAVAVGAASAVAEGAAASSSDPMPVDGPKAMLATHEWKPNHWAALFWTVHRKDKADGTNMSFERVTSMQVMTNSSACIAEPLACTAEVQVPIMVNSVDLAPGDELVVHWPAKKSAATNTSEKKKQKSQTWVSQAAKKKAKTA